MAYYILDSSTPLCTGENFTSRLPRVSSHKMANLHVTIWGRKASSEEAHKCGLAHFHSVIVRIASKSGVVTASDGEAYKNYS